jgi:hypothetical protein
MLTVGLSRDFKEVTYCTSFCNNSGWDEIKGGWRKLHNEELHNLYSFKSRRLGGHIWRREGVHTGFW